MMEQDDFTVPEEVQVELDKLKKKNRYYGFAFIGIVTASLLVGSVMYANQRADADLRDYQASYSGYSSGYTATTADYSTANSGAVTGGSGGGCGGGASGQSGGCGASGAGGGCGGGKGALLQGGLKLTDLEKQALALYTKEGGDKSVTSKATDFGCHIQVDIYDAAKKVVKSYGYRGEALYVIK